MLPRGKIIKPLCINFQCNADITKLYMSIEINLASQVDRSAQEKANNTGLTAVEIRQERSCHL